jgi:putative transposase
MSRQLSSEYPVKQVCEALDCPRSTHYYEPVIDPQDAALLEAIEQVLMRWPFYGYRRMTAQLKREGYTIGETRVRRLLGHIEHSVKVGRVKVTTTDSNHDLPRYPNRIKGLQIERPNQVWQSDITYIRLGRRFIYLAVILDAYTRGLRGWHLSCSLDKSLTISALKMALQRHPAPESITRTRVRSTQRRFTLASSRKTPRSSACQLSGSPPRMASLNGLCGRSKRSMSITATMRIFMTRKDR